MQSADRSSDKVIILALQSGLRASNFMTSFLRNSTTSLVEITGRAYQDMNVEEMLYKKFMKVRARVSWLAKPIAKFKRGPARQAD